MIKFRVILGVLFFMGHLYISNAEEKNYRIITLVNDQVITNYDLEQRLKLFAALNNININKENIDRYGREMLLLMIDEKLQLEQIKLYKISISDDEINNYIKRAYLNKDQNLDDLAKALEKNSINIDLLIKSTEIKIGWNILASSLFYRESEINKDDLKSAMKKDPSLTKELAENSLLQKQIGLRAKKLLRDLKTEANIENR